MNYLSWRDDIFGRPNGSDPVRTHLDNETYSVCPETALTYITKALSDREIHVKYSQEQIGFGLNVLFNNSCSDFPIAFVKDTAESSRERATAALSLLYTEYFMRYCTAPLVDLGNDSASPIDSICYMFWDVFVVYPGNSPASVVSAGLEVMRVALRLPNDRCKSSAIHGLGHWVSDVPEAKQILEDFVLGYRGDNEIIQVYAQQAITGCIQ